MSIIMKYIILTHFCYIIVILSEICACERDKNVIKRTKLLEDEFKMATGGHIELDEDETKLNDVLMKWKQEEFDYWFSNPEYFNFTKSFFDYNRDMKKSKVYRIIEKMPKGGLLHVHASAILEPDFYINLTYRDNLFVCFAQEAKLEHVHYRLNFKFSSSKPNDFCTTNWQLMSDVRNSVQNVEEFDMQLRKNFTMVGTSYKDTGSIWKHFKNIFVSISGLLTFRPVWEEYCFETLKKLKQDKIMYAELRSVFFILYELDGTKHDSTYFVNITKKVVEEFNKEHSDFLGAKIIGSYARIRLNDTMGDEVEIVKDAKRKFPDFIAGFDLIGYEDFGGPLVDYLDILEDAKGELDYFFHAGETNWFGTFSDENLFDAVLLGTKRIGHGYALIKHPILLEEVKKRGICVEVSVVSNTVLGLTKDARTHPLATLLALNVTTVAAGDDPGLWGAPPISADLYVTFMGVASRRHDLRLLKQLARNSIHCAALSETEKQTAMAVFSAQWKAFVREFAANIKV